MLIARLVVGVFAGYAGAGALFALAFVAFGLNRLDSAALGAGWGFRLLIWPGAVAFWPLLAWRWLRGLQEPPTESTEHRRLAAQPAPGKERRHD